MDGGADAAFPRYLYVAKPLPFSRSLLLSIKARKADHAVMYLVFQLPTSFIYEQFFASKSSQSPFVQKATRFEDFVIRCVRYAFANVPPKVGRVFFSRAVALPFLRWRLLRHGYLRSPFHWREYQTVCPSWRL